MPNARSILILLTALVLVGIAVGPASAGVGQTATWSELTPPQVRVRVVDTAAVSISAPGATIDSVTMALDDRVLRANPDPDVLNGIYLWKGAAVPMVRAPDADANADFYPNMTILIAEGTSGRAGSIWMFRNTTTPTLGTTELAYTPLTGLESGAVPLSVGPFSTMPDTPLVGEVYIVTDAPAPNVCTAGAAVTPRPAQCIWDGERWNPPSASLDDACQTGEGCDFTSLTEARPLRLAPVGLTGPRRITSGLGGDYHERFVYGSEDPPLEMPPDGEFLPVGAGPYCIRTEIGTPLTVTELGCIENTNGTAPGMVYTGMLKAAHDLSLCTTHGAVGYYNGTAFTCLAPGTNTHVLTTHGAGVNPTWEVGGVGGGGGGSRRMQYALDTLTHNVSDNNVNYDTVDGTNFDYAGFFFADAQTGCVQYSHRVSANLAATPAWRLKIEHKSISGGLAAVVLTTKAKSYASNAVLDVALTSLEGLTSCAGGPCIYGVNTSANTTHSTIPTTGDFDAEEPLAAGQWLKVQLCRIGASPSDTLAVSWQLIGRIYIEYLESD
jgi:hypothetical protein